MASQLNSSYLDNKLKSLRGGGAPVQAATIRTTSPGVTARYPQLDTVSSNMSFPGGHSTFQPTFVNKERYFPVQMAGKESPRLSPVLGATYASQSRPLDSYSREKTYEPIRRASPLRAVSTPSYELKANPEIYSLAGLSTPSTNATYTGLAPTTYTPSYALGDMKRLLSPHEESAIMNNMRNELMKLNVDDFQGGSLAASQDEIRSLRERLPMERQTTARLEKNMVEQLLEDDAKRQALAQKLAERDAQMRQLTAESSQMERDVRQVGSSYEDRNRATKVGRRK